jgi:hypothetical protein
MNDMWKSTDGGATWVCMTSSTEWNSSLIDQSAVITTDGIIVMMGGWHQPDTTTNDVWQYPSGTSGNCVLTSSAPGDIYNIGGVSGESTKTIVFTLWDNQGYGRGQE